MRVILVSIHPYPSPQAVPLAAASLKAALSFEVDLSAMVSVSLINYFLGHGLDKLVTDILELDPDAVGLSVYVWNHRECREVAAALRRKNRHLTIFAGGPEAMANAEQMLAGSVLDFIITGEGEATFVEAMSRLSSGQQLKGTKGVAVIEQGVLHSLPGTVGALDNFPSPYLSGVLEPTEQGGVLWELSRGCSFACDFCFDHKGSAGVRSISMARITEELKLFVRKRVTQVFVLDSTFNQDMNRAKAILRLIKKVAPHIHFHFEVRSEFLDAELARLFAETTCSLQIGLQSADPIVLRKVGRVFNPEDFKDKIGKLNNAGAIFGFDLIYGLPDDSLTGFSASLDFALRLYPNHLDIFPLAVLPATKLAMRAAELGLDWQATAPYTVRSSPTFPEADMLVAARLAAACNIFYSRGKAVAWCNSVLQALRLNPVSLLDSFSLWLSSQKQGDTPEDQLSDDQIWQMQRQFLQKLFNEKKKLKLLPLAHDLVDYHYYYAKALLSPVPDLPTDRELEQMKLLDEPLALASSAALASFNYEIFDILETGEIDLREFSACFQTSGSYAVVYPRGDDVFTESLIEPYYLLLQALGAGKPARGIIAGLGLPEEEATAFLEFAVAEGIVGRLQG